MSKVRLQKYFSDCGIMSRRAAEKEIAAGSVYINGSKANLGDSVDSLCDIVEWNGKIITPEAVPPVYIMLNKPMGYVSTASDEKGRPTVTDLVNDAEARVYPVGRLDMYSEGLLILTNDGELTNRLTHPSGDISKTYMVKVKGIATEKQLEILRSPMTIDGYRLRPVEVELVKKDADPADGPAFTVLRFTLHEGRNRQIRRMCEQAKLTVMRLRRIGEGSLELKGLAPGMWRYLTPEEIAYLKGI